MIAAIEFLFALAIAATAVLVYRRLIHSRWFSRIVAEVTTPTPEDEVVLDRLDAVQNDVADAAESVAVKARKQVRLARSLRERIKNQTIKKENA